MDPFYCSGSDYGFGWHSWYGWPSHSSLVVVQPRTIYVDRPVETVVETYVDEQIVERPVIEQPSVQMQPGEPLPAEAVTLLPSGDAPSEEALLAPLERGDAAFAAGDYAEARRHYIRAQLDGPYAGEATLAYALTRFAGGDYSLAAMALRRGLTMVPDAIDRPLDLLHFYADPGELEAHLLAATTHLAQHPDDAYGWFVLGYVHFGRGDAVGALAAFDRAVALDSQDQLAYLLRDAALAAVRPTAPPRLEVPDPPAEPQQVPDSEPLRAAPPELL